MEFEWWWLLSLPLFFGLGWVAARIDLRQLLSESRALPRSYFKGLDFLLKEQPDKAIEAFIEVVKVDPQTVELHFALGNLFRRRGELDRAIRMHQNLAQREDLGDEQKLQALLELGQDYLKAGLLDRAEEVFGKLSDSPHRETVLRHLLDIYQQEKDWSKAIAAARNLAERTGHSLQKEIAQFYCELAEGCLLDTDPDGAKRYLQEALQSHRQCMRATILLGDVAASAGQWAEAINAWKRIESQDPAYLALVAEKLLDAHRALGKEEDGLRLVRGYLERYPSLDLMDVVFQTTLAREGAAAAYRWMRDELRRTPTLLGLDRLLEAQLLEAPLDRRRDLELIRNLVRHHTRNLALYCCDHCGFKARQFYWRCPACGGWETCPPRRTEEREGVAA